MRQKIRSGQLPCWQKLSTYQREVKMGLALFQTDSNQFKVFISILMVITGSINTLSVK